MEGKQGCETGEQRWGNECGREEYNSRYLLVLRTSYIAKQFKLHYTTQDPEQGSQFNKVLN